ncbi:hypothetical protein GCM10022243_64150 [Saccharothrix violaceirubra]
MGKDAMPDRRGVPPGNPRRDLPELLEQWALGVDAVGVTADMLGASGLGTWTRPLAGALRLAARMLRGRR